MVDDERLRYMATFMNVALMMCGFFVVLEGVELFKSGPTEYFSDMWNLMDWLNFLVFFQVRVRVRARARARARLTLTLPLTLPLSLIQVWWTLS